MRGERGFTAVEIVVVVLLIVGFALFLGLQTVTTGHPREKQRLVTCQNNLRRIGGLLAVRQAAKTLRMDGGAAFLLQVADQVKDEDLKVFICPGEQAPPPERPDPTTPEFIDMFCRQLPESGVDDRMCSYAGPDWTGFSAGKSAEPTLWACDRCDRGIQHHKAGIVVLYANTSKVELIATGNLEGHKENSGEIIVGPDSPDPRLRPMTFCPRQDR